eukprot:361616-Chlamydomonas_euryale.AAC.3
MLERNPLSGTRFARHTATKGRRSDRCSSQPKICTMCIRVDGCLAHLFREGMPCSLGDAFLGRCVPVFRSMAMLSRQSRSWIKLSMDRLTSPQIGLWEYIMLGKRCARALHGSNLSLPSKLATGLRCRVTHTPRPRS